MILPPVMDGLAAPFMPTLVMLLPLLILMLFTGTMPFPAKEHVRKYRQGGRDLARVGNAHKHHAEEAERLVCLSHPEEPMQKSMITLHGWHLLILHHWHHGTLHVAVHLIPHCHHAIVAPDHPVRHLHSKQLQLQRLSLPKPHFAGLGYCSRVQSRAACQDELEVLHSIQKLQLDAAVFPLLRAPSNCRKARLQGIILWLCVQTDSLYICEVRYASSTTLSVMNTADTLHISGVAYPDSL